MSNDVKWKSVKVVLVAEDNSTYEVELDSPRGSVQVNYEVATAYSGMVPVDTKHTGMTRVKLDFSGIWKKLGDGVVPPGYLVSPITRSTGEE